MKKDVFNFRYLTLTVFNNGINLILTDEGREFLTEEKGDKPIDITYERGLFNDLFEDVRCNSDFLYFEDIGEAGFGLTSAPGITDGYYYDDNGDLTDKGNKDSNVYWYPDYMIKDPLEDLDETGVTFFNKG